VAVSSHRFALGSILLSLVMLALLVGSGIFGGTVASAAAPPELWTECEAGSAMGQCSGPRGVAADRDNGHVFVADQFNSRINEFNALGQFVKTWGAEGNGKGQLVLPQGVAVDSTGNVYVAEGNFGSRRVQKFDSEGNFVLMFGGQVNKTKVDEGAPEAEQNLCTAASGDVCQAAVEGTGNSQFGAWVPGSFIAIDDRGTDADADDLVYVGDQSRIQVFDTEGVYQDQLTVPGTVKSLATDVSGNLYVIYDGQPDVRKLTPTGAELPSPRFALTDPDGNAVIPTAVAVDSAGHVFAFGPISYSGGKLMDPIFEFDPDGKVVNEFGKGEFVASTGLATNLCAGSDLPGNLYVTNFSGADAFLRAYGTEPFGCFKARTRPASNIEEASATINGTVTPDGSAVSECLFEYGITTTYDKTAPCAESPTDIGTGSEPVAVHADVDSLQKGTTYHFRLLAKVGGETEIGSDETFKTLGPPLISDDWTASATSTNATLKALINPEGLATTVRFEYGLGILYGQSTPVVHVGSERTNQAVSVILAGLAPGRTYHWRLVATNSGGTTTGEDHTVTTYRPLAPQTDCPNQPFRTAFAAFLPDCRAYEMVSPVDKNGGDIIAGLDGFESGGYVQVSPDGEKITYTTSSSFGDQSNSFLFNQYLATRRAGSGWSNRGIHPQVSGRAVDDILFGLVRDFIAFSPDLCAAWLIDYQAPTPTPDGQEGYRNLYRSDNCEPGAGGLEALTPSPPPLPAGTPVGYVDNNSVQGRSDDSRHAIFVADAALTPHAATTGNRQIYDRFEGELRLLSILPDGKPITADVVVGSGWLGSLDHAVSRDGSRVYWTSSNDASGTGTIYLRQHPEREQSEIVAGACTEPAKACTAPVSASGNAFFWTAAADGSKALYSEGKDLYEFDLRRAEDSQPPRPVAGNVRGVAGASDDLSRVYLVSTDVLGGAQQNNEGDEAVAGQPNLYLEEGGRFTFIATLIEGDLGAGEPDANFSAYNVIAQDSHGRSSRVTPDGARIVFQSRAPLSGYENTDANSGKPAVEVFTYVAGGQLRCVSCNPSGARPSGRELRFPYNIRDEDLLTKVVAAAWIPTWEQPLYASNVLSEDGERIFFNSNDALVPRDTNGVQDVYEWEAAGKGSCDLADPSYFPRNGGCLHLISSGGSPFESVFWGASPDGEDVFFTTEASLLPQDPGLVDLYDARVDGGFPQPSLPAPCEGEACQSPPPPPGFGTPSSAGYSGPGSTRQGRGKRRCRKNKRRVRRNGKPRCVKKHRKHRKRQAAPGRRAAR
jgi:DNA-binding beta-propeller fold protein YncE